MPLRLTPNEKTSLNALLAKLCTREWSEHARSTDHAKGIPAGVTYLSQLMGHDMFLTEPNKNILKPQQSSKKSDSLNLMKTPLMLNTLYGTAGTANRLLYTFSGNGMPLKFDLFVDGPLNGNVPGPKFMIDPRYRHSIPTLADGRNRSTPILMQICQVFMRFHNHLVDNMIGVPDNLRFSVARACVTKAWHSIVFKEILASTCRQVTNLAFPVWMEETGIFDNPEYLSKVALRCFHSLVRPDYNFTGYHVHSVEDILVTNELNGAKSRGPMLPATNYFGHLDDVQKGNILEWGTEWKLEWDLFFSGEGSNFQNLPSANRTGFTPSFTFSRNGRCIQLADFDKASQLENPRITRSAFLKPSLENFLIDVGFEDRLEPKHIPLTIALLAESRYQNENRYHGKLGKLGSAIVRRQVVSALKAAKSNLRLALRQNRISGHVRNQGRMPGTLFAMAQIVN